MTASSLATLALALVAALVPACSDADVGLPSATAASAAPSVPVADAPLSEQRAALLDLAFDSVSKMPSMPHVKDRSRDQEAVVTAALELEQPLRAARYIPAIDNWRRGTAFAELACWCAEHGATAEVESYLTLAQQVVDMPADQMPDVEGSQDWRRERILARIAKAHVLLGRTEEAAQIEAGLPGPERSEIETVKARSADAAACDEQIAGLGRLAASSGLDEVRAALDAAVEYHARFYDDEARRDELAEAIETAAQRAPLEVQIEVRLELADAALAHHDREQAVARLEQARALLEGSNWDPDDRAPLDSRMILLRAATGDAEAARREADAALAHFEEHNAGLNSIRQARALRPLAEAYAGLHADAQALALYARAVELGAENPNARPRAEELSATCCSMARRDVPPDEALWSRMQAIGAALVAPW